MSGPALLLLGFAATGRPATGSGLLAGVTIAGAVGGPVTGCLLVAAATELCAAAAYLLAGPGWLNRGRRAPVTTPPGTACTGSAARTTARSEQGS